MTGAPQPKSGARFRAPAVARLTAARLAAVQALYQIEVAGGDVDDVVAQFGNRLFDRPAVTEAGTEAGMEAASEAGFDFDPRFFGELVRGVTGRRDELDGLLLEALAADWPPERLQVILRCILLVGACELVARRNTPARVVIAEHVDLAHAFFAGAEPGMVNAVLDRLARRLRPGELGEGNGDGTAPAG